MNDQWLLVNTDAPNEFIAQGSEPSNPDVELWFDISTDPGVLKVKAIMEEKGLLDVDDAVAIFERRNPPPAPIAPGGSGAWNFMDDTAAGDADADIKKMIETKGNSDALLNTMINKTLGEVRGSRR